MNWFRWPPVAPMPATIDPLQSLASRVRVARWSRLWPDDLAAAVVDLIDDLESAQTRREKRNRWIQRAGAFLPGSPWVRAGLIRRELMKQSSQLYRESYGPDGFRGACEGVLLMDACPPSRKTIARVLELDTAL